MIRWTTPRGFNCRMSDVDSASSSPGSSPGSTAVCAVSPCVTALSRARSFPSSVRGPVDFFAFCRFAAMRFSEAGIGGVLRLVDARPSARTAQTGSAD
jgi:hypothetical protein